MKSEMPFTRKHGAAPWEVILCVILFVVAAAPTPAQDKPDPGAAELKKAMMELREAIKDGNDTKIVELAGKVLPDAERIGKGLGAGAGEGKEKVVAFHARMPKDGQALARLFAVKPAQTEVQVHGSTTEEMAAYENGSVAAKEFPAAVKALAEKGVFVPGKTYYEVEFLEPGNDVGMKYHLFYWDGSGWSMLGPVWRMVQ
ncbi:hypothetical protein DES53_107219 [Roseimicrobium gellanilyticum]|uniref:Uncharacterized protein n=1 Tax=Roseimicrobium gellanilyticum TaxID=748857 RepID=A0A366HFT2_9BACT|nr:hypothetical protein [Roseimicrobium gellanilyticum]RBP41387.1 hypothetical protein DES53_107219 [Roseimicrobium gellanilyticum]